MANEQLRREADKSRLDKMRGMGLATGGHVEEKIRKAVGEHDKQLHGGKHTKLTFADGGGVEEASPRRDRRARGGPAKSGKGPHVNIVIAHPGGGAPPPVMPPPSGPPVMPPPGPPIGGPPMMGGAPGGVAGGPPVGAMAPRVPIMPGVPMRARGGKVPYPIDDGAGGGEGRLEKIKAYGKNADIGAGR